MTRYFEVQWTLWNLSIVFHTMHKFFFLHLFITSSVMLSSKVHHVLSVSLSQFSQCHQTQVRSLFITDKISYTNVHFPGDVLLFAHVNSLAYLLLHFPRDLVTTFTHTRSASPTVTHQIQQHYTVRAFRIGLWRVRELPFESLKFPAIFYITLLSRGVRFFQWVNV